MPQVSLFDWVNFEQQGGSGCSWKWNFRAESIKCRASGEAAGSKLPEVSERMFPLAQKCIDVF